MTTKPDLLTVDQFFRLSEPTRAKVLAWIVKNGHEPGDVCAVVDRDTLRLLPRDATGKLIFAERTTVRTRTPFPLGDEQIA